MRYKIDPDSCPSGEIHASYLLLAIDEFAMEMKRKLLSKLNEGYTGWNEPNYWSGNDVIKKLKEQIEKRSVDPIDIGNYAMFLWNIRTGVAKII